MEMQSRGSSKSYGTSEVDGLEVNIALYASAPISDPFKDRDSYFRNPCLERLWVADFPVAPSSCWRSRMKTLPDPLFSGCQIRQVTGLGRPASRSGDHRSDIL